MLDPILQTTLTLPIFLACTAVSILLGIGTALLSLYRNRSSQSFAVALAILPAIIQVVIMLVNGNIGAGVAVAGAFSLVRFRSAAGSAREIGTIFLSMAIGLATGMGYVVLAILFFAIMAVYLLILTTINFGGGSANQRKLKITIPEDLDYDGLFDDLFARYTNGATLEQVKTTSMGTLYELHYTIHLRSEKIPKQFLDDLRCRNGNLNIVCSKIALKEAL